MVKYVLRFTEFADEQLDAIYSDKRAYINGSQFREQFRVWNYELLQYLRQSVFLDVEYRGTISLGRIGELYYQIFEAKDANVVVIERFYFSWLPFEKSVTPSKRGFQKLNDAGYGYYIAQNLASQKMAILNRDNKPITKFVFDSIIGFHHSVENYNVIHAIGFIGDRVYSISMQGIPTLLHLSKNDYLSMKHLYDEALRRKLNTIVEKHISNKYLLINDAHKSICFKESQFRQLVTEVVRKTLRERLY